MTGARTEGNDLFLNAFRHAAIGMALLRTDGRLLKVNQSLCEFLGYTEQELLSFHYRDVSHPDDLKVNIRLYRELICGKRESYRMEKRYIHKGGHVVWGLLSVSLARDEEGQPLYCVCQLQDITDRKGSERAIRESEESYRNLLEHSPDAVLILKGSRIIYINDKGLELAGGASKDDIIGRETFEFIHPDYHDIVQQRVDILKGGEMVPLMEEKFIRMNGEVVDIEVKAIPAIYYGERVVHAIVRDISERKKAEEVLINTEKRSVAGQLAAGIAHEVRNPLTAIKGFFQLIKNGGKLTDTYIDIILSEINRIEMILSELLVLAKPIQVQIENKNLRDILDHVIAVIETQTIMKNIEIKKDYACEIPQVFCDQNQLKQVFINFLQNAVEAMSEGGTIAVSVQSQAEKYITVRIVDQGEGIPADILERLGEPFLTTKENGTGLGLMICYQIIEKHNGQIDIGSCSAGTTIDVQLPVAP